MTLHIQEVSFHYLNIYLYYMKKSYIQLFKLTFDPDFEGPAPDPC